MSDLDTDLLSDSEADSIERLFAAQGDLQTGRTVTKRLSPAKRRIVHPQTGHIGGDFVPGDYASRLLRSPGDEAVLQRAAARPDFIQGNESAAIDRAVKRKINDVAKTIWEDYRDRVERYARAAEALKQVPQEKLAEPDEETENLIKIVEAGPPMTKERALQMARQIVASKLKRRGA